MVTNTAGGQSNVAVGNYSMDATTSGDYNVAVGHNSLTGLTEAGFNVAIGQSALDTLTEGNHNIGIGYGTGGHEVQMTTATQNVLIGSLCDVNAAASANQIVMGYNVMGNTNNSFVFGNAGTDSAIAFGATSISAPSDIRLKENINDSTAGLSFINDLRPVTFNWKKEKDIPEEMRTHVAGSEERYNNDNLNHGFIAQEVKETINNHPEIKDGFKMWFEDGIDGRQRIAEGALVPMLVKSIQELSQKVEAQQNEIDALKDA